MLPQIAASTLSRKTSDTLSRVSGAFTRQELLGDKDVSMTMIYTHVLNKPGIGVKSPLD
jgi:integrase